MHRRSKFHPSKLFSVLMLAWTGCNVPPPETSPVAPEEEPVACEGKESCGSSFTTPACSRVHLWDIWQFGTDKDDVGVVVDADSDCNIYLAGNTRGRFSGGGSINVTNAGGMMDVFSIRVPAIWNPGDIEYPGMRRLSFPEPRLIQVGSRADDSVRDFAVAEDRSVYLVGATADEMPGANAPGQGFNDIFATKLNSQGNLVWTKQFGSSEEDSAQAVAVRKQGPTTFDIYVAGTTQEDVDNGFDITLDTLSSSGDILSRRRFGTPSNDRAEGLALDSSGNVFIVGSTMGSYSEPGAHAGSTDVFAMKLAQQNLDEEEWKSQVTTSDIDAALDAVIDNAGNLYVLTVSFSDLERGASENDGIQNSFLIKYAAGTSQPAWIKRIGVKTQYSRATGMTLDAQGRVYVAGFTNGSMVVDGGSSKGGRDAFVARYDAQGVKTWVKQIGTTSNDEASDVVVTKAGDVVITGFTMGDLWGLGREGMGMQDAFIARFNPDAQP